MSVLARLGAGWPDQLARRLTLHARQGRNGWLLVYRRWSVPLEERASLAERAVAERRLAAERHEAAELFYRLSIQDPRSGSTATLDERE
jgi:hypothetical protein